MLLSWHPRHLLSADVEIRPTSLVAVLLDASCDLDWEGVGGCVRFVGTRWGTSVRVAPTWACSGGHLRAPYYIWHIVHGTPRSFGPLVHQRSCCPILRAVCCPAGRASASVYSPQRRAPPMLDPLLLSPASVSRLAVGSQAISQQRLLEGLSFEGGMLTLARHQVLSCEVRSPPIRCSSPSRSSPLLRSPASKCYHAFLGVRLNLPTCPRRLEPRARTTVPKCMREIDP